MSDNEIPPAKRNGVTAVLREMAPGESRLFLDCNVTNISACAATIGRGLFRCRTEGKNVRCWRLKEKDGSD